MFRYFKVTKSIKGNYIKHFDIDRYVQSND